MVRNFHCSPTYQRCLRGQVPPKFISCPCTAQKLATGRWRLISKAAKARRFLWNHFGIIAWMSGLPSYQWAESVSALANLTQGTSYLSQPQDAWHAWLLDHVRQDKTLCFCTALARQGPWLHDCPGPLSVLCFLLVQKKCIASECDKWHTPTNTEHHMVFLSQAHVVALWLWFKKCCWKLAPRNHFCCCNVQNSIQVNDQLVHLAGWFPMHKNSVIRMIGRDARSIHGYSRYIFPFDWFDTAMATVCYSCEQSLISLNLSSLIRRPQRSGPHKVAACASCWDSEFLSLMMQP